MKHYKVVYITKKCFLLIYQLPYFYIKMFGSYYDYTTLEYLHYLNSNVFDKRRCSCHNHGLRKIAIT